MEKKRREVLEKCASIIEEAKRRAGRIKLEIPAREIEKIVSTLILEYLGE
jgi:vacuolar-type H+-ATPase subunit H